MKKVSILVPSFRPELFFERLLPVLQNQVANISHPGMHLFEIFVVVPEKVDLSIFVQNLEGIPVNVIRSAESGYSIPRNLLWNAAQNCDIRIFVDDDELPSENWLKNLLTGIETYPNYSVYFGDVYFTIPASSPNKSFSRLLPQDRIGSDRELFSTENGIANAAFLTKSIPHLVDPFRLDFNQGGEDISFFSTLKGLRCRFFELSGCAVIEEWELSRLQAKELMARSRRGIIAYYKLRQEGERGYAGGNLEYFIRYARVVPAVLLTPLLLCLLILNIFNPFEVFRIQARCFVSRIYQVSFIPWRLRFNGVTGSMRT